MKNLNIVSVVVLLSGVEEYIHMDLTVAFCEKSKITSLLHHTVAKNLNALDLLKYKFLDSAINQLSSDMHG